jgi:hypothetical protein
VDSLKTFISVPCSVFQVTLILGLRLLCSGAVGALYTPAMLVTVVGLGRLDRLCVIAIIGFMLLMILQSLVKIPVLLRDNVLLSANIASVAFLSTAIANPLFFLLSKACQFGLLFFPRCFGLLPVLLLNLLVFCINLVIRQDVGSFSHGISVLVLSQ